ncbi:MAG: hypothetical protein GXP14_09255 [Gammaproteobacteria bacterium]|nr:hypothetical protein [Gammaproteobacteria bacterium]
MNFTTSFNIPKNHPCFTAHFPSNPIVPGALLASWIISQLQQAITDQTIMGIKNMKFLQAVHPGECCTLHADHNSNSQQLNVYCTIKSTIVCKGTLLLS